MALLLLLAEIQRLQPLAKRSGLGINVAWLGSCTWTLATLKVGRASLVSFPGDRQGTSCIEALWGLVLVQDINISKSVISYFVI